MIGIAMPRLLLGLSTGSSASGVDVALVEADGAGMELRLRLLHFLSQPFPRELHDLLLRATQRQPLEPRQAALAHRVLGDAVALAARQTAETARVPLNRILCLGMSG